jgi:hypothetical protein
MRDYDFNDEDVVHMVERDHVPQEQYERTSYAQADGSQKYMSKITCERCDQVWPCTARVALRRHQGE